MKSGSNLAHVYVDKYFYCCRLGIFDLKVYSSVLELTRVNSYTMGSKPRNSVIVKIWTVLMLFPY